MSLLDELGLRKVINACSTATHLGGSIPDLRVMESMMEISQRYVIMAELQEKAGELIAELTGAESAMVTAGASSALELAAAACILRGSSLEEHSVYPLERLQPIDGPWKEVMQRLPNSDWSHNEFIIQATHRNPYDYSYRAVGGKLTDVGDGNGCTTHVLEVRISAQTAAVAFSAHAAVRGVPLNQVVEIAHKHGIPVIVDAATGVLPRSKLKTYFMDGADLVAISGGKQIAGPNDTGILCGRRSLVDMAKLQASPFTGIGRSAKVDRTQILGLIKALRIFLEKNPAEEEAEFESWRRRAQWVVNQVKDVPGVEEARVHTNGPSYTRAYLKIGSDSPLTAYELAFKLRKGDPSIWLETYQRNQSIIGVAFDSLLVDEERIIVEEIERILTSQ